VATLTATSYVVQEPRATGITENFSSFYVTIEGKKKHSFAQIKLTTSGSVPSAGLPLPTYGRVGMVRNVDYYILIGPTVLSTANFAMSVTGVILTVASGGRHIKFKRAKEVTAATGAAIIPLATAATLGSGLSFLVEAVGW